MQLDHFPESIHTQKNFILSINNSFSRAVWSVRVVTIKFHLFDMCSLSAKTIFCSGHKLCSSINHPLYQGYIYPLTSALKWDNSKIENFKIWTKQIVYIEVSDRDESKSCDAFELGQPFHCHFGFFAKDLNEVQKTSESECKSNTPLPSVIKKYIFLVPY